MRWIGTGSGHTEKSSIVSYSEQFSVNNKMKILVAGDSFSAQWANCSDSWTSLLDNTYIVNNIAQPGVGEYKILKQLESVNIDNYDCVIVSHTSPSRIHIKDHPIHRFGFHKNCDLIISELHLLKEGTAHSTRH